MIHPCDKPCGNKTASGYCVTTSCINPQYSNIGTVQYGQGVQKRIVSNADRIRAMSDEELARFMWNCAQPCCPPINCAFKKCDAEKCWLSWLKSPVEMIEKCGE